MKLTGWKNKKKIAEMAVIAGIVLLFVATRLYDLTAVPRGIHVDEAGMLYDAWCLATYHTDRWLNHLPVYLPNFGGGQSALYAYLAAMCVKVFGMGLFAARIPAVISGAFVLIFGSLLTKEIFGKKWACVVATLITICPYFIMASRFGLDCNLFLGFFTMSLYLLWKAIETGYYRWYFAAGISFGATLYTYALSYGVLPLFLLSVVVYLLWLGRFEIKKWIVLAIPLGGAAIPLMLFLAVNNEFLDPFTFHVFATFSVPALPYYRGAEVGLSNIKDNLILFRNILTYGPLTYNALPEFGTLYYVSIPFVVLGFVSEMIQLAKNIKNKAWNCRYLICLMGLSVIGFNLMVYDTRVINKNNAVFMSLVYFLVAGIRMVVKKWKPAIGLLTAVYMACFLSFGTYYYTKYAEDIYPQEYFDDTVNEVLDYVDETFEEEMEQSAIYFSVKDANIQQPNIYVLLRELVSPYDYAATRNDETWKYGKYHMILPNEIDENGFYILSNEEEYRARLVDAGFKTEWYGNYCIAYRVAE